MGMQLEMNRVLIWNKETNQMEAKTEIVKKVVGNQGTVFFEAGPLYVENEAEILEASQTLDRHLLSMIQES